METSAMCEIFPKLPMKMQTRRHWRLSDVFIFNFEQILQIDLVFPLLTLSKLMPSRNVVNLNVTITIFQSRRPVKKENETIAEL